MSTTTTETAITLHVKEPWHETQSGRLAMSLCADGIIVRVQQRKAGDPFYRVCGNPESWRSLETRDQMVAQSRAEAFLRALAEARSEAPSTTVSTARTAMARRNRLTVGRLFTLYLESETHKKNKPDTQAGDVSRSRIIIAGLGEDLDVDALSDEVLTAYTVRRAKGGIVYHRPHTSFLSGTKACTTEPASQRTLGADVGLLRAALLWAHTKHKVDGRYLLAEMPIREFNVPKNKTPKRPVANMERFQRTLAALHELALEAPTEAERRIWLLTAFALVLVESTGRRISAVLHLRWRDFDDLMEDTDIPAIYWNPANDKKATERRSPKPPALAAEIARYRALLGVAEASPSAWVFAQVGDPALPYSHDQLSDKLVEAEQRADLPKLKGGVWHPYRRKWATERQGLPVKDVMAAGGWEDFKTYLNSYVKENPHTQLDVMSHPIKLHADGKLRGASPDGSTEQQATGTSPVLRLVG